MFHSLNGVGSVFAAFTILSLATVSGARAHDGALTELDPPLECEWHAYGPAHHPTRHRRQLECKRVERAEGPVRVQGRKSETPRAVQSSPRH